MSSARAARALLRLLRAAQPISRVELARRLDLDRSTVTDTFKPLVAAGVVLEDAAQRANGAGRGLGRPPAELRFNTERDLFVGVNVGVRRTQVGAADLGGEVYRGTDKGRGIAGEFGHMTIVAGGKPCPCGNRGCWERYAAASAAGPLYMGERVRLGSARPPRYVEVVARAGAGDLRARRTLERIGEYLGMGIGNVIVGLGMPRVIVSGRIVEGWKFVSGPLRGAVAQGMAGKLEGWSVGPGEPRGAGLGGAIEVAVDGFLTSTLAP